MVVGSEVEVPVGVGWFPIDSGADSFLITFDQYIKKGDLVVRLCLSGELYQGVLLVDVIVESLESCLAMWPQDESVFNIS